MQKLNPEKPRLKSPRAQANPRNRQSKRSNAGSAGTDLTHAKLTVKTLKLADLKPHHKNPRIHPDPGSYEWESLKASLANVYFDPLVVNARNNHTMVSGHLRKKILEEMGVVRADCVVVDVDEQTHLALLLRANNPSGEFDNAAVTKLLKELERQDFDINLTGFGEKQIVQFLAANKKAQDEQVTPRFEVVVECKNERQQQKLYERFIGEMLTVRLQTF